MPERRKTNAELVEETVRLRAQVAQLEDRIDHLTLHGAAAKALERADALHHTVMSAVADAVLITDDHGKLTYVSPNANLLFGKEADKILKQGKIRGFLPKEAIDPDALEDRDEVNNVACRIRDTLGRARDLLVSVRRLPDGSILYVCRDVTERVRIESEYEYLLLTVERRVEQQTSELRDSRDRYRRMVEGVRDEYLFYAADKDSIVTYVSPSIYSILGYTPKEVIGSNWRRFIDQTHPLFPELEKLEQMRFAGLPTPVFRAPVLHADGSLRILEFRDSPVLDAEGNVTATEGIGKDITERLAADEELRVAHDELERRVEERTAELKEMNERLQDSEQRYRSVVDDQLEFICRWRGDGIRTFVNESYCRARNATREELIGTSFMPDLVEADREALRQQLSVISKDNPMIAHECRVVLPNGQVVWERWSNRALFNEQGELIEFQSVGSDVTERRKREQYAEERSLAVTLMRGLSEREMDVMRLVVEGDANKVIARKMGLSIKTIEKHRSNLMKKLQVRSVPELVRRALLVEEGPDEAGAVRPA